MNATITSLEFERDEAFEVTVSVDRLHTHQPAHSVVPATETDRSFGACRAWPTSQGLIYVVDTYPRLAALAQTILEVEGLPTCAFDDRSMAWHAFVFAKPKPLLLITDNLDGDPAARELCDRCRSIAPRLKTLLVDHRQSFSRQIPKWTDGLISLPYSAVSLIQEVKRLCMERQVEFTSKH